MEGIVGLIIQLVAGAVGGNVVGSLAKNLSLGTLGNSLAGIVGGGLGGTVLASLGLGAPGMEGGGMDIGAPSRSAAAIRPAISPTAALST